MLASFDLENPTSFAELPEALREISGLVVIEGRLFAHDDERGVLYELDPTSGGIGKAIPLGPGRVSGDFEGVARAGDRFVLVTSTGTLAFFREGAAGEEVRYSAVDAGLARTCEVEGLGEVPGTERLLIACKTLWARHLQGSVRVYEYDATLLRLRSELAVDVGVPELWEMGIEELSPSGVAVHAGGHMLVVAARQRIILEVDPAGRPVAWARLLRGLHRQPEGIAFLADGSLILADEGGGRPARLTVYAPRRRP